MKDTMWSLLVNKQKLTFSVSHQNKLGLVQELFHIPILNLTFFCEVWEPVI